MHWRHNVIPLSYAQQRLWFLNKLEGSKAVYNSPLALRLSGPLDRVALRTALSDVVGRHESLRTTFPEKDGVPYQNIVDAAESAPALTVANMTEADLAGAIRRAVREPFDLTVQTPMRAWLFALSPDEHVLLLVVHHVAGDGWSIAPLWRDVSTAYAARCDKTAPDWVELPVQYVDYTLWQRELLGDEKDPESTHAKQLQYWRSSLQGLPEELRLPADRGRPTAASRRGVPLPVEFDNALHSSLVQLARTTNSTVFMVLQAAVATLMTKLGAGRDIPVGTAVAGRTDQALHDLVGFFVNTLVLRTDTSGNPPFTEVVRRVRATNLEAYAHQDLPFDRLVEVLNPPRVPGRHPLVQIMLTLQNTADAEFALRGLAVSQEKVEEAAAQFDIEFTLEELQESDGRPAGIQGYVTYAADLFDADTAEHINSRFVALVEAFASDPRQTCEDIDIPPMPQKQPPAGAAALEPRTAEQDPSGTAPRNEREAALCDVFAELLGIDQVGIHESFFALGGHSLLATRLMSRIRTVFGVELNMGKVFEAPSVAELCAHIDTAPAARPSLAGRARSHA